MEHQSGRDDYGLIAIAPAYTFGGNVSFKETLRMLLLHKDHINVYCSCQLPDGSKNDDQMLQVWGMVTLQLCENF